MDFIFMLTNKDKTVIDALGVLDSIEPCGIKHIGFKDIGLDHSVTSTLVSRIKEIGAISYLEVVSTSVDSIRNSITIAAELGIDRVLGGQEVQFALSTLKASGAKYYPFVGKPTGHPTKLEGTPEDIARDCRRMIAEGCTGVDLLAYRSVSCDPIDLVSAARIAMDKGYLIVAGSINTPERIHALSVAGADAFTVGSAVFDLSFAPDKGSIRSQCIEILEACGR